MVLNDDPPDARYRESQRLQRRRLWLGVLLPILSLLLFIAAYVVAVLSLRSPVQVQVVADSTFTALVLIPLAVCMFPLLILSLALVVLAGRLQLRTRSPLRRLERWTAKLQDNADQWLGGIDDRVLDWAVRLAPLRQALTFFDSPKNESDDKGDE